MYVCACTEVVHGQWSDAPNDKGLRTRNVSYTLAMNFPVGPKTAPTTELQVSQFTRKVLVLTSSSFNYLLSKSMYYC